MDIHFTKMHGLGNDFIVLNNLDNEYSLSTEQISLLGNRHFGIGFDQLLVIESAAEADIDFSYRIFNIDGQEAEHCGNGARCFAAFVKDKKLTNKEVVKVETAKGDIELIINDDGRVLVDMGEPVFEPGRIPFVAEQESPVYSVSVLDEAVELSAVSMGNPHAVMLVDDMANAKVETLGALLESHTSFPNRVNVGFMQVVNRETIKLRVFERGVGETQACGSGACAAVAAGIHRGLLDEQVSVQLLGGELMIQWAGGNNSLLMTGSATKVFDGKINL